MVWLPAGPGQTRGGLARPKPCAPRGAGLGGRAASLCPSVRADPAPGSLPGASGPGLGHLGPVPFKNV